MIPNRFRRRLPTIVTGPAIVTTEPARTPDGSPPDQSKTRRVAVLGATGSIGTATIDVLKHLDAVDSDCRWRLATISGHQNIDVLESIFHGGPAELRAETVLFSDPDAISSDVAKKRFAGAKIGFGPDELVAAAADPSVDTVVAAIVGRAGLESTVAAVESGKRVALANKETLVVAGGLVREKLQQSDSVLYPVDSEHSAIWQCIEASPRYVKRLILTASGGPFRTASQEDIRNATPESALAHPTWQMGRKITIDSATMMNKALEVIEARWLFDVPAEKIEVMVHPQSIIHSLVEFDDGSVLAQLSPPDMRLPIQYALTHPRRLPCPAPELDRERRWDLELIPADRERFPALELGFRVARDGGTAGAVVNAANEVAVGLFLDGQIRFTEIVDVCRKILENHSFEPRPSLSQLLHLDKWAREEAARCAAKVG